MSEHPNAVVIRDSFVIDGEERRDVVVLQFTDAEHAPPVGHTVTVTDEGKQ